VIRCIFDKLKINCMLIIVVVETPRPIVGEYIEFEEIKNH